MLESDSVDVKAYVALDERLCLDTVIKSVSEGENVDDGTSDTDKLREELDVSETVFDRNSCEKDFVRLDVSEADSVSVRLLDREIDSICDVEWLSEYEISSVRETVSETVNDAVRVVVGDCASVKVS
ncbi:MAG: hypothetical protein FJ267_20305, partial [Planctomycetes bacterium]|nr:hypothetical protein [Planctomycetota bacterium]